MMNLNGINAHLPAMADGGRHPTNMLEMPKEIAVQIISAAYESTPPYQKKKFCQSLRVTCKDFNLLYQSFIEILLNNWCSPSGLPGVSTREGLFSYLDNHGKKIRSLDLSSCNYSHNDAGEILNKCSNLAALRVDVAAFPILQLQEGGEACASSTPSYTTSLKNLLLRSRSYNSFIGKGSGCDIVQLSQLVNMEELELSDLTINPICCAQDVQFHHLKKIKFTVCMFSGDGSFDFSSAPNLRSLSIRGRSFPLQRFTNIELLEKLDSVKLLNCFFFSDDLKYFSGLTKLKSLSISSCQTFDLTPPDLSYLSAMVSLQGLKLRLCGLRNSVGVIENLRSLKRLTLWSCDIPDAESIGRLTTLEELKLIDSAISDLNLLSSLKHLRLLWLENTKVYLGDLEDLIEPITTDQVFKIADQLPHLEYLYVQNREGGFSKEIIPESRKGRQLLTWREKREDGARSAELKRSYSYGGDLLPQSKRLRK